MIEEKFSQSPLTVAHSSFCTFLWKGQVKFFIKGERTSPRLLFISNAGIFIFKVRTFPSGIIINHNLQYSDLTKIKLMNNKVTLFFLTQIIEFFSDDASSIVSSILLIRNTIFPAIVCEAPMADQLYTHPYSRVPGLILADRFMSFCSLFDNPQLTPQLDDFYTELHQSNSTRFLNPDILSSPFASQYLSAIAYDTNTTELILKNLSWSSISPFFQDILIHSTSIKTIEFKNFSFAPISSKATAPTNDSSTQIGANKTTPSIDSLCQDNSTNAKIPLSELTFNHCTLDGPDFQKFLQLFQFITNDIIKVTLHSSEINPQNLQIFFSKIRKYPCFSHLSNLELSSSGAGTSVMDSIVQFFISSPAVKQNSLKTLSLNNCNIEGSNFLPALFTSNPGLNSLSLSYCSFSSPINPIIDNFFVLNSLNLSKSSFSSKALLSLLKSIGTAQNSISDLIMNKIRIKDSSHIFYQGLELQNITIPSVRNLIWSQNEIPVNELSQFVSFLKRENLVVLDLSESFDSHGELIKQLVPYIKTANLDKLMIKVSKPSEPIRPLLEAIRQANSIAILDISGHNISDDCVDVISDLVQNQLIEFYFNNTTLQYGLVPILNAIISSKIVRTNWPKGIPKTPISLSKQLKNIKVEFDKKYSQEASNKIPVIEYAEKKGKGGIDDFSDIFSQLKQKDEESDLYLKECLVDFEPQKEQNILLKIVTDIYGPKNINELVVNYQY